MLYAVILQCKTSQGSDRFVQDVTCAPEPMEMINSFWIWKGFAVTHFKFSILGIDPTFNLGEFSVTPMVYRHLLLEDSKAHKAPLVLGPLLVHHRKQFRSYNYFLSSIVGLRPKLKPLELMVRKHWLMPLKKIFCHASQLRCFRHLQQNVEAYLRGNSFLKMSLLSTYKRFLVLLILTIQSMKGL